MTDRDTWPSDGELLAHAEQAAFRLLYKFHRETDCGSPKVDGLHWAECEALVDAFEWQSWEVWSHLVTHLDLTR